MKERKKKGYELREADRKLKQKEERRQMSKKEQKEARSCLLYTSTNLRKEQGSLADIVKGADVFIGVSAPKALTVDMVKTMNQDAIVFA